MRPARLVLWGFVLVGVSPLLLLRYESASPGDQIFYFVATTVGFAILGFAARVWLLTLATRPDDLPAMRPVLKGFALACLVLGLAYLGLLNELRAVARRFHSAPRWEVLSDVLSLLGFVVAAGASGGRPARRAPRAWQNLRPGRRWARESATDRGPQSPTRCPGQAL